MTHAKSVLSKTAYCNRLELFCASASLILTVLMLVVAGGVTAAGAQTYPVNNSGADGGVRPRPVGDHSIQHVVIVFQENRTPDNLFHGLPNADVANRGLNSKGQLIALTPSPLAINYSPHHDHRSFRVMFDGGRMDGADKIQVSCYWKDGKCPPANPQFKYVSRSDVAPYFQLAEQYAFADRMFQTNQGPSFPAHQFIISALRRRPQTAICLPRRIRVGSEIPMTTLAAPPRRGNSLD